jgi:Chalcone isomerase-like
MQDTPTLSGINRRAWLAAAAATSFATLYGTAAAQDDAVQVEGQPFARRLPLAGSELVLNGTGVRAVAWFKGFAAGLYLPRRSSAVAQVLAMPGPKRVQMRMLQEVPAEELVKALRKGLQRNSAEPQRLAARFERLGAAMLAVGTVKKGDVIDLDQDPTRGTLFALNGTLRGEAIEGGDFYAALLASFVGERPYDPRLKAGLLGLKPAQPSSSTSPTETR